MFVECLHWASTGLEVRDAVLCCHDGGLNLCVKAEGEEERQELKAF